MISLRNAAERLGVTLSAVQRRAKALNMDTSKGLTEDNFKILENELRPEDAPAEIVYLEPTFQINLPKLTPPSGLVRPTITDEQVEGVQEFVKLYTQQVEQELQQAREELELTEKRNKALSLEAYKLQKVRELAEKQRIDIELQKSLQESLTGKSISDLEGGNV